MQRKIAVAAVVAAVAPAVSTSAEARSTMCMKAYPHRVAVVKKHGKRAPGRNICRFGVKTRRGKVRRPTSHEKGSYLRALRRLHRPPPMLSSAGAPRQPPAGTQSPRAGGTLAAIRACESGGSYSTNTGNGFYGAYQFTQSTWNSVGGSGNPAYASPAEQDRRAAILYAREGASPWPVCGR